MSKHLEGSPDYITEAERDAADWQRVEKADAGRDEAAPSCRWTESDPEMGYWNTCKLEWCFPDPSTPADHSMKFCPFCGKLLTFERWRDEEPSGQDDHEALNKPVP